MQLIEQTNEPAKQTLEQALLQVVRGSNNQYSVVGPHSLLETMYGNVSLTGSFNKVTSVCGGQLLEFSPTLAMTDTSVRWTDPSRWLGGCVVTITNTDSPCYGLSTVIAGIDPTSSQSADDGVREWPIPTARGPAACIINGFPFSGPGFGFDPPGVDPSSTYAPYTSDSPDPNYADPCVETPLTRTSTYVYTAPTLALPPANPVLANSGNGCAFKTLNPGSTRRPPSGTSTPFFLTLLPNDPDNRNPIGGANTDYTAPDIQHMVLAGEVPFTLAYADANGAETRSNCIQPHIRSCR